MTKRLAFISRGWSAQGRDAGRVEMVAQAHAEIEASTISRMKCGQ